MQENYQNFENYFLTEYTTVLTRTMSHRKVATSYSSQCESESAKYTSKESLQNALQKSTENFSQTKRKKSSLYEKKK